MSIFIRFYTASPINTDIHCVSKIDFLFNVTETSNFLAVFHSNYIAGRLNLRT